MLDRTTGRLAREWAMWREEPMKRVAVRNRPLHPLRRRQFASFGAQSLVDRPTWLYGAHKMSVGNGSIVLRGCWLAVEKVAWSRPEAVLHIGDGVWMRPYCTLSAAASIVIEDDVVFGSMVTVVDSDHTYDSGDTNVLYNPVRAEPVHIGRGSWLADRVAVLAGSTIGEGCIIGANSVVRGHIPDHSIAVGAPAKVVRSTR